MLDNRAVKLQGSGRALLLIAGVLAVTVGFGVSPSFGSDYGIQPLSLSTPLNATVSVAIPNTGETKDLYESYWLNNIGERIGVRFALKANGDKAFRLTQVSVTPIAGTKYQLVVFRLMGLNLQTFTKFDLSGVTSVELGTNVAPAKEMTWAHIRAYVGSVVPKGPIRSYKVNSDGTITLSIKERVSYN